jgi:predicted RNA-binding protein with PIN domain
MSLMRWLIDGYNLMHAQGALPGKEIGREAFRRKRRRFLNELASALGSQRALETMVVFDASAPPQDFGLETTYKGLSVVFAVGDENADARIERLIAEHSAPRSLTVVSSDRRIRRASARRRAISLSADEFLDELDRYRSQSDRAKAGQAPVPDDSEPLSPSESEHWRQAFQDLDASPEISEAFTPDAPLLTDAEIAEIEREIDQEG